MRLLAAALMAAFLFPAQAEDKWLMEFEFAYGIPSRTDRLLVEDCERVVPVDKAAWYAQDPRDGFTIACGNNQPMFLSFVGRKCWKPIRRLTMYCGWTHFSSPMDRHEVSFDALSIRGRFTW